MTEIAADPGGLRAAAAEIAAAADRLGRAFAARASDFAPPGQTTWVTAAAMDTANAAWQPYLEALQRTVRQQADDVRLLADNFAEANQQSARIQRRHDGAPD